MLSFGGLGKRAAPERELASTKNKRSKDELVQELVTAFDVASKVSDDDEALEAFQNILDSPTLQEDMSTVHRVKLLTLKSIGHILQLQNDSRCVEYYGEAMNLDPSDVALAFSVAQYCISTDQLRLARTALEKALMADPSFWPALATLLELVFALKDPLSCLAVASQCLRVQPRNARALQVRALVMQRAPLGGAEAQIQIPPMPPKVAPIRSVAEMRITQLSWDSVFTGLMNSVKESGPQLIRLFWSDARRPAAMLGAANAPIVVEDVDVVAAVSPRTQKTTTTTLRRDEELKKQQELLDALSGFVPIAGPGEEDDDDDDDEEEEEEDCEDSNNEAVAAPSPSIAASPAIKKAQLELEIASVEQWLSELDGNKVWDALELVDTIFFRILSLSYVTWSTAMQRKASKLIKVLLHWDVAPRPYFLALAEVECVLKKTREGIKAARRLMDKFAFAFHAELNKTNFELVARVERVKGQMCKYLDRSADALLHYNAVAELMADRQIKLPHLRDCLNSETVQVDIASLGDTHRADQADEAYKRKEFATAIDLWTPLLLPALSRTGGAQFYMEPAKLNKAVKALRKAISMVPEKEHLLPQAMLLSLRVCKMNEKKLFPILAELRSCKVELWSVPQRRKLQKILNHIIVANSNKPLQTLLLVCAWLSLFHFLPRPLMQDGVSLLEWAQRMLYDRIDLRRSEDGEFLRLVVHETQNGLLNFDSESLREVQDKWYTSLHDSLHLLYDVKMPEQRKVQLAARNKKRSTEVTQKLMADAFRLVGTQFLGDADMVSLTRKIQSRFSQLPEALVPQLSIVTNFVEGTMEEAAGFEQIRKLPDAAKSLHAMDFGDVYRDIYSLHGNHVIKYTKPMTNRARGAFRKTTTRKWFESKSAEEPKRLLLLDLAVNPLRFDSWFLLADSLRCRADQLISTMTGSLSQASAEVREKLQEFRTGSVRSYLMSLHCTVDSDDRKRRAEALVSSALQLLAASRLAEDEFVSTKLLTCALDYCTRAKEVHNSLWIAWYMSATLQRKLRAKPLSYLTDMAQAVKLQSSKQKGSQFMLNSFRAKLLIEGGSSLDELDSFAHYQSWYKTTDMSQIESVYSDICAGLRASAEENMHHAEYLCARMAAVVFENDLEKVARLGIQNLQGLMTRPVHASNLVSRTSSASSSLLTHTAVRQLEGYGLPDEQVRHRITRKILSLYLSLLDGSGTLELVVPLYRRLIKHVSDCESNNVEFSMAMILTECGSVLYRLLQDLAEQKEKETVEGNQEEDGSDVNRAVDEELDVLRGVLALYEGMVASEHLCEVCTDAEMQTLLRAALPEDLKACESPLDAARSLIPAREDVGTGSASQTVAKDSPNYSAIRRPSKQRKTDEAEEKNNDE